MKILLLNPPNLEELALNKDSEKDLGFQPLPVGLLLIYKAIAMKGYNVDIENLFEEKFSSWDSIEQYIKDAPKYDFIGITCSSRQRFSICRLITICGKFQPQADLILGGPHATYLQYAFFERFSEVNCVILGEGEDAVVEYIKMKQNGAEYSTPGISFRSSNGNVHYSNIFRRTNEINSIIPFYNVKHYLDDFLRVADLQMHLKTREEQGAHQTKYSKMMAPIICSRGCTGNCFFCSNGSYFNSSQRYYDINIVFEELKYYYEKGIRMFDFYDDNLTHDNRFVFDLCRKIIENGMNDINWWCSSRVNEVNPELLTIMKKAGCFKISYGVESGSIKILNRINKKITVEQIRYAFEQTKKVGILARATISFGHVGENWVTIQETIDILNEIKPDNIGFFIMKIYPGTPLYCYCCENKYIDDNYWFDSKQDLVPFFTYETSLETLRAYREFMIDKLAAVEKSNDGGDINAGSIHLGVKWSE